MLPLSRYHSGDRSDCFDGYGQVLPDKYTPLEPRGWERFLNCLVTYSSSWGGWPVIYKDVQAMFRDEESAIPNCGVVSSWAWHLNFNKKKTHTRSGFFECSRQKPKPQQSLPLSSSLTSKILNSTIRPGNASKLHSGHRQCKGNVRWAGLFTREQDLDPYFEGRGGVRSSTSRGEEGVKSQTRIWWQCSQIQSRRGYQGIFTEVWRRILTSPTHLSWNQWYWERSSPSPPTLT